MTPNLLRRHIPDGIFAGSLTDLSDISTREALGVLDKKIRLHVSGNRGLAQDC